ncbi:cell division protein FtsQ [Saccharopolyspora antimicrobica]|uniref:Cell division protein FtsQ n=1 Tax=Saccharopolyspora antimicrobica TaxID=455193 RepID=A0A1I5LIX9_9PSEU|nr:FtsQ-type POTRA domain-containing protein [Saccharopolyspora antimicrobica]RKT86089.1 cell division protein FtsQ [Saccharopolyspora antimicrobica]SFO97123.1 cell division protein FtsQ [Saccharopolyspora antimicrobica]
MTSTRRRAGERPGVRSTRGRPVRGGAAVAPKWRRWALPLVLAAVTVLALVLYFTPVLGVRSVEVLGNTSLDQDEVVRVSGIETGTPMLRVDAGEIRDQLQTVPKIASAEVTLSWPSSVQVRITERVPAAFLVARNGIQLVDASGMPFQTVPEPPAGLPELKVREASQTDPATKAGMRVLTSVPEPVRGEITAVLAENPNDIRLLLKGDRQIEWGSQEDAEKKAAIIPALLTRPGKVYDVTTPALPTVS